MCDVRYMIESVECALDNLQKLISQVKRKIRKTRFEQLFLLLIIYRIIGKNTAEANFNRNKDPMKNNI